MSSNPEGNRKFCSLDAYIIFIRKNCHEGPYGFERPEKERQAAFNKVSIVQGGIDG